MDAVNLLPLEYRDRKRSRLAGAEELNGRRTIQIGGAVALLFAVLIAGLYLHERSIVNSKQKDLAETQARIAAVQPQVDAVKSAQAAISGRLSVAQQIAGSRMNWDRALNDFARVMPTNSFVTNLTVSAPASAAVVPATGAATATTTPAPAGGGAMTIQGIAPNTPGVALVMDRLALLPWLSGVTLQSAARQIDGTDTFNMAATVAQER